MWTVVGSDRTEFSHYGVKGMKWGVRKEYEPHPRKRKKQPKYYTEEIKWEKVDTKRASKRKNSKVKGKNLRKIGKYAVAGALVGIGGYALYKYYRNNRGEELERGAYEKFLKTIEETKVNEIDLENFVFNPNSTKPASDQGSSVINFEDIKSKVDSVKSEANVTSPKNLGSELAEKGLNVATTALERDAIVDKWRTSKKDYVSILSKKESMTWFRKNVWDESTWESLTGDERDAIKRYTGDEYLTINKMLRGDEFGKGSGPLDKEYDEIIKHATNAISKNVLNNDIITHRGVESSAIGTMLGLSPDQLKDPSVLASLKGSRYVDKGFCSTGACASSAWDGVKIHIAIPKGSQGMYVDPISLNPAENEFLLQRNTEFMIDDVVFGPNGTIADLMVSVVNQLDKT